MRFDRRKKGFNASINSIANAKGDKLIGIALGDFSMTVMGEPVVDDSGGGDAPTTGGGCG